MMTVASGPSSTASFALRRLIARGPSFTLTICVRTLGSPPDLGSTSLGSAFGSIGENRAAAETGAGTEYPDGYRGVKAPPQNSPDFRYDPARGAADPHPDGA